MTDCRSAKMPSERHELFGTRGPLGSQIRDEAPGQVDGKPGARADPACHIDLAVDRLHQVLYYRQAQPGSAQLAAPRLVDPVETFEDARQVGPGDANASVGDLDGGRIPVAMTNHRYGT